MARHWLIELDDDDYDYIVNFDPDRDRSASRRELVDVIADMQETIVYGTVQHFDVLGEDDDRNPIP